MSLIIVHLVTDEAAHHSADYCLLTHTQTDTHTSVEQILGLSQTKLMQRRREVGTQTS